MTGRAKGRARGRTRSVAAGGASPCCSGEPQVPPTSQSLPEAHGACAPGAPQGVGGRASSRGSALPLSTEMGAMSSNDGDNARTQPRVRRRDADFLPASRTRPDDRVNKQGTSGRAVTLVTNYFRLNQTPDWSLYHYQVDFVPEVEHLRTRRDLLNKHREQLGRTRHFDGGSQLFLRHRLPKDETELYSERESDGAKIRITLRLTALLPPDNPVCLCIYNSLFRRMQFLIGMEQVGRQFFFPKQKKEIPEHRLEMWPGFTTAISKFEESVMLCMKTQCKLVRTETVWDKMDYLRQVTNKERFHETVFKAVVGEIVITTYSNRTFAITDVAWDTNPLTTFKRGDTEMTYVDYYQQRYNVIIKNQSQPLLMSMIKKRDQNRKLVETPILLVPELCRVTGLTNRDRGNYKLMKDVSQHTRLTPRANQEKLITFINTLTRDKEVQNTMKEWDMGFENQLVRVPARTVDKQAVRANQKGLRDKKELNQEQAGDWSYDLRNCSLLQPVHLPQQKWLLVFDERMKHLANKFLHFLKMDGPALGMKIETPLMLPLQNSSAMSYDRCLRDCIQDCKMVVCLVPTSSSDLYSVIKKRCCLTTPVPSQVILRNTLSDDRKVRSVVNKIAIQMNCKLGGEAWEVEIPLKGLMVVGMDVFHEKGKKSVSAFVASTNRNLTKYYSRCNIQHATSELCTGLHVNMTNALEEYLRVNGALPQHIVVYRDGVGAGQIAQVVDTEVSQLKRCFADINEDTPYSPKLTVVIVTKRINTRFFDNDKHHGNPSPGTVVDAVVTRPEWYDFFLVSQSVRQGTVTPTHYNVVCDEDSQVFTPERIQLLTYKLTHLYYNWPGTIRVPAPCQYAHKLAFLVGKTLHAEVNNHLCNKLFYL